MQQPRMTPEGREAKQDKKNENVQAQSAGGPSPRARQDEPTASNTYMPRNDTCSRGGLSGTPGTLASGRLRHNGDSPASELITRHARSCARVHATLKIGMASHANHNTHGEDADDGHAGQEESEGVCVLHASAQLKESRAQPHQHPHHIRTGPTEEDKDGQSQVTGEVVTETTSFAQALAIAKRNVQSHGTQQTVTNTGTVLEPLSPTENTWHAHRQGAVVPEVMHPSTHNMQRTQGRAVRKRTLPNPEPHEWMTKRTRTAATDLDTGEIPGNQRRLGSIRGVKTERLSPAADGGGFGSRMGPRPVGGRRQLFRGHLTTGEDETGDERRPVEGRGAQGLRTRTLGTRQGLASGEDLGHAPLGMVRVKSEAPRSHRALPHPPLHDLGLGMMGGHVAHSIPTCVAPGRGTRSPALSGSSGTDTGFPGLTAKANEHDEEALAGLTTSGDLSRTQRKRKEDDTKRYREDKEMIGLEGIDMIDERECDCCGRSGHLTHRCWNNFFGENYRGDFYSNKHTSWAHLRCWHCRQDGHVAKDCHLANTGMRDLIGDRADETVGTQLARPRMESMSNDRKKREPKKENVWHHGVHVQPKKEKLYNRFSFAHDARLDQQGEWVKVKEQVQRDCTFCNGMGHRADECWVNPQGEHYRAKMARVLQKCLPKVDPTRPQYERINTIRETYRNENERINTATEGHRQRTASADEVRKKAKADDKDIEDSDMKPEISEQRTILPVCGEPTRTLGFRPDFQQGRFFDLMKQLETRMIRDDTSVKTSIRRTMDAKIQEKMKDYTNKVQSLEKDLEEIKELLRKANLTETTGSEANPSNQQVVGKEVRAGQQEGGRAVPLYEAWMQGVEKALSNIAGGIESDLGEMSNTLDYHEKMIFELYAELGIEPPVGNMPSANNRGGDRDEEDGGQREDDLEGSHGLGDGGADFTSQPSEQDGGTSQHAMDGATQQANQEEGQTQEKNAEEAAVPSAGIATEEEPQRQQEVGAGEDGSHELPTVEYPTTGIPDGGADDLVMTNRGIFARREHNPVLDIAREKFTQHPVAPPVPPTMLFKPPSERVNAIGVSWKGSFEGNMEEDIDLFLDEFELHCVSNGVDPTLKAATLRLRLTGMARTLVAAMPATDRASYDKITGKLRATFNRPDRYLAAREKIDRLPYGASLSDFIVRLVPLMQRAYPDASEEVREVKTFDLIMDRAPSNVRMELKRAKCHTLAEVIRCGPEAEALAKDLAKEMGRRQAQPVNATYTETEATNVGIVGTRLDAPRAPIPSRHDEVTPARYKANRATGRGQMPRAQTQPNMNRPTGRQAFGGQQPMGNQRYPPRTLAPRATVTCGHCGMNGHAAMFCWRNPQSQHYRPGFGEPRIQQQGFAPPGFASRIQPGQYQQPARQHVGYNPQLQLGYTPEPQMGYGRQMPPQRPTQIQCYACGGFGHIARQCPSENRVQGSNSEPNIRRRGRQVFQGNDIQQLTQELARMRTGNGQGQGGVNPVMQVMHQVTPQPSVQVPTATASVGTPANQVLTVSAVERQEIEKPHEEENVKRSYTYEEGKALEEKIKQLSRKFYRRDDREEPATDIVTTLTRHENGDAPEYRPPDFRMVIIPVKVNGVRIAGLLDTGSSITLASRGLAEELGITTEKSDKTIKSMTCHTEAASEKAGIMLDIAGHRREVTIHFTTDTLWTDNPYDMIIGGDTLQVFPEYRVHTAKRRFTMGEKPISWKTKAEIMLEERKVFVIHDVTIPPRHEVLVDALIDRSKGKVNTIVSIEQAEASPIQLSDTLADVDKDSRCKILLSNPTEVPIVVRKYTTVGKARNVIEDETGLHEYPEITATLAEEFRHRDVIDPTYTVDYEKCDCTPEQKEQLKALLEKYKEQFSKNGYDLGMAKVNPMHIRTTTEQPYRPSVYQPDRGMLTRSIASSTFPYPPSQHSQSSKEMSPRPDESTPTAISNVRKRRHYSVDFKLKVITEAKEKSVHSASRVNHLDRATVRDWIKHKEELQQLRESSATSAKRMRLSGAGRPLTFKDLDEQLAAWVRERRSNKLRVSRRLIQLQAERLFNAEEDDGDFKASRGWLEKFQARHNFRLRVPTSVCQKPPSDYAEKLARFVVYVSKIRQENRFQAIYAGDETAVWLDPAGAKCIDECGAKEVSVRTTGHDKMRVTVMLLARADGYKCKPYVLLPRKRPDPRVVEKFKSKLFLAWAGKVWMDDELTSDFLQRVLGSTLFGKRLLVWDAFRCHISESTKKRLRELKIHTAVVPGGCTKFVQPADVSWNGPFKAKIKHLHDVWMSTGDRMEWTANGNPRAPSMDVYLDWIVQAWESISKEAIIKSFRDCGITVCHDGSEDDEIHCFKPHGPVPGGRTLLRDERQAAAIDEQSPAEEPDGEEDERNGYLSDDSLESV